MENEKQNTSPKDSHSDEQKLGTKPIGIPSGQTGGQTDSPTGEVMPQHPAGSQGGQKK